MGQIVAHVAIPKKLQFMIDDLEKKKRQEEANPGVGIFTDKMARDLEDYTKQLEDIKSGESILSTKPEKDGWIKKLLNYFLGQKEQDLSSSQYLMNRGLGETNPWMNMPGVQVASTGDLTGMGIPNALQQQQQQAELMQAGNLALNQTPAQVQAQVAAAQATQQGNYQAPTMTQQQMVQEAQQTGGTVNPFEATQAAYTPSTKPKAPPGRPVYGPHGKAHGGVVSLMDLLNRRV